MKFRKIKLKSPRAIIRESKKLTGATYTDHETKNCGNCVHNLNNRCDRKHSSTYGEKVNNYCMCPIICLKDGYLKNIIRKLI